MTLFKEWLVQIHTGNYYCLETFLPICFVVVLIIQFFFLLTDTILKMMCYLMIRFFVRINPEGTKCAAKSGTSRKTGSTVKRKVQNVNPHVHTFLQSLTEFEWKTSN